MTTIIKHPGIYLTRSYETSIKKTIMLKDTEGDPNNQKCIAMFIFLQLIYTFSAIPIKICENFFLSVTIYSYIYMYVQRKKFQN